MAFPIELAIVMPLPFSGETWELLLAHPQGGNLPPVVFFCSISHPCLVKLPRLHVSRRQHTHTIY